MHLRDLRVTCEYYLYLNSTEWEEIKLRPSIYFRHINIYN